MPPRADIVIIHKFRPPKLGVQNVAVPLDQQSEVGTDMSCQILEDKPIIGLPIIHSADLHQARPRIDRDRLMREKQYAVEIALLHTFLKRARSQMRIETIGNTKC